MASNRIPNKRFAKQENFFTSPLAPYNTKIDVVKKKTKTFFVAISAEMT